MAVDTRSGINKGMTFFYFFGLDLLHTYKTHIIIHFITHKGYNCMLDVLFMVDAYNDTC